MPSENIVGKEENAGHQHFLLFPNVFTLYRTNFAILITVNLSSANTFNFKQV